MKKLIVISVFVVMLLSFSACVPSIKTEDGEISFKDGKIEIETEEGSATITEGEMVMKDDEGNSILQVSEDGLDLPEGYPINLVPIIGESSIMVASEEDVAEGKQYWLTIQSKKDIEKVMKFYKDVMKSAEEKQVTESTDMNMIIGVKDGMHISLTIFPEEDGEYKTVINAAIVVVE